MKKLKRPLTLVIPLIFVVVLSFGLMCMANGVEASLKSSPFLGTKQINSLSTKFSPSSNVSANSFSASALASDGYTWTQPVAYGPEASFTPLNGTSFRLGDTVMLNGSFSTPSYDTSDVSEVCPIVNYVWLVKYPNGTVFGSYAGAEASFIVTDSSPLEITLLVTASDPHPPSSPDFFATSTQVAWIYVDLGQRVVTVDVFTDKGGEGLGVNGGVYAPQEYIRMYAFVSYRNVPLVNRDVVFTVQNSFGSTVAVRVGRTNETGFASADFRLPAPDPRGSSVSFGGWSVLASVDVSQVTSQDSMNFTFSFLSKIQDIQTPLTINRTQSFPLYFVINTSAVWSELDITLFDALSVPIGSFTLRNSQPTLNFTAVNAVIPIPSWASVGPATAYICLLADSSDTTDIPLAPETISHFEIQ